MQYLTITCPNISYVVNQVSRFLQATTTSHYHGLNNYFVTSRHLSLLVRLFLGQSIPQLWVIMMLIGLDVWRLVGPLMATQYSEGGEGGSILYPRVPGNNQLSLDPIMNLNIELWSTLLQKLFGSLIYYKNSMLFHQLDRRYVIIRVLFFSLKIRSLTNMPNTMTLATTLFVNLCHMENFIPSLLLPSFKLSTFLQKVCRIINSKFFKKCYVFVHHHSA